MIEHNAQLRCKHCGNDTFMAIGDNILVENAQLRADKAKAEAACAEMREVLDYIQFDFDPEKHLGPPCGPDALKKIKHALSSDCGKGWVSPEELKPTIAFLNELAFDELGRISNVLKTWARQELSRLQKLMEGKI